MKDVKNDFIEKICIFCLKHNGKNECMKIIRKECDTMTIYKCENFNIERKTPPELSRFIKYTFYDDMSKYIAIIKKDTPVNFIYEMRKIFDEVKYREDNCSKEL